MSDDLTDLASATALYVEAQHERDAALDDATAKARALVEMGEVLHRARLRAEVAEREAARLRVALDDMVRAAPGYCCDPGCCGDGCEDGLCGSLRRASAALVKP